MCSKLLKYRCSLLNSGLTLGLTWPSKTHKNEDKKKSSYFRNCFVLRWCHQQENYYLLSVDYHRFIVSSIWKSTWFSTQLCFIVLHRYKNDSFFKYLIVSISHGILLAELPCWYLKLYIFIFKHIPWIIPLIYYVLLR